MIVKPTPLRDCLIIEPKIFRDERGFFLESFNQKKFNEVTNSNFQFVQDNHSKSSRGVLRGLHYQITNAQGKLVRVTLGEVYDVVVDLRRSSSTFGKSFGLHLNAENMTQLWIPAGFAHGFVVLSDSAEFVYKTTDYYSPEFERTLMWNDADLNIDWHFIGEPILSAKDKVGVPLIYAETYP